MEENTYKESLGKTFKFFIIYVLAFDLLVMLILFLLSLVLGGVLKLSMHMDSTYAKAVGILYLIIFVLSMIPLFLVVPFVRKKIVNKDPGNAPSANKAILWLGILRLLLFIMTVYMRLNWSAYLTHLVFHIYFMIIYSYYKSKLNTQIENIEGINEKESYANKQNIENSNIKRSNIEKLDINKADVKTSDINKSDIKNQDIEDFDIEEFDTNEPAVEKLDIEEFNID
jgi:hypothetical protein